MNRIHKEEIRLNKRWNRIKRVKGLRKYINKGDKKQLAWKLMQTLL